MSLISAFACLQPILTAGITSVLFRSLPIPILPLLVVSIVFFTSTATVIFCVPKGRWWIFVMSLLLATVVGVQLTTMELPRLTMILLLIATYPLTHFYLHVVISSLEQPEVTPTVEEWGIFAWISERSYVFVAAAVVNSLRWIRDFLDGCLERLEHWERLKNGRGRRATSQPPAQVNPPIKNNP